MSRSGRALLSVLALVGSTLAGAADAAAHPGPEIPIFPDPPVFTDPPVVPPSIVDPPPGLPENIPPTVVIESPVDGSVWEPGEPLPFRLTVTDDGVVDCTKVVVTADSLAPVPVGPDCTGVLTPEPVSGFHSVSASYVDDGMLAGSAEVVLNPREFQASSVPHINLAGVDHLAVEFAAWQGGNLTVHADSPDGPVVASFLDVPAAESQWLAADVLDPGGVHDLHFVADQPDLSVMSVRFQTVPAVSVPAVDGWRTTDVPVVVSTAPLWDPQVSLDGGVTWVPAPAVLSADGVYDVRYRVIDVAGRTSEPGATTVKIDKTAPAVTLPGREYKRFGTLDFAATDAGSGPATLAATLDGVPVTAPVELWHYPAGVHQLAVTTTDAAGNTATHTTEIEITTSLADLTPLLTLRGVPFVKAVVMRLQLTAAAQAHEAGRDDQAVAWVRAFLRSAAQLRDPATRDTLTTDATLVIAQLNRA
jgi:hypothetical protein